MKLASLKSTNRDGSLIAVSRDLQRYSDISDLAPTMQHALENWHSLKRALVDAYEGLECGNERPEFDFQQALREGKIAAPLPRTHQWLDGSAYLSHVERVRRARNDKVPDSFYHDPLMYQGGGDSMLGDRPRGYPCVVWCVSRPRYRQLSGRWLGWRPGTRCVRSPCSCRVQTASFQQKTVACHHDAGGAGLPASCRVSLRAMLVSAPARRGADGCRRAMGPALAHAGLTTALASMVSKPDGGQGRDDPLAGRRGRRRL